MNARAWERHKADWCEFCRHDTKRRPCPLVQILDADSEDPVASRPFARLGRCSQFEVPPKRERKAKNKTKRGKR